MALVNWKKLNDGYNDIVSGAKEQMVGAKKIASEYGRCLGLCACGKISKSDMELVEDWMEQQHYICVRAARLHVDVGLSLKYMMEHEELVVPLFRLSKWKIGTNVRAVLRQALKKQGIPVAVLNQCVLGSDLARYGVPYVLSGGRVAFLETLSPNEVELAVESTHRDDVTPHSHRPLKGLAASDGMTGMIKRIDEVLESGK